MSRPPAERVLLTLSDHEVALNCMEPANRLSVPVVTGRGLQGLLAALEELLASRAPRDARFTVVVSDKWVRYACFDRPSRFAWLQHRRSMSDRLADLYELELRDWWVQHVDVADRGLACALRRDLVQMIVDLAGQYRVRVDRIWSEMIFAGAVLAPTLTDGRSFAVVGSSSCSLALIRRGVLRDVVVTPARLEGPLASEQAAQWASEVIAEIDGEVEFNSVFFLDRQAHTLTQPNVALVDRWCRSQLADRMTVWSWGPGLSRNPGHSHA